MVEWVVGVDSDNEDDHKSDNTIAVGDGVMYVMDE
jgi:hypothetical protein